MSARRLLAALLLCAVIALAFAAAVGQEGGGAGAAPKKLAYAATLPDSAGRAIAERWCLMCHSAMLITQQSKDSTGWEKTLAQMEKWGVAMAPEERDSLRTYLVTCFGPRAPK